MSDTSKNRIISTISNKGGVGKTLFSIEMANFIGRSGKRVLLIDTDMNTGDISTKLNLRVSQTLLDYFEKKTDDLSALVIPKFHFDLLPGAGGNFKFANINYAQKRKFIRAFQRIAARYEYTILDLGAGIDRTTLDFALTADYPIIITTPEDIPSGYGCAKAAAERLETLANRTKTLPEYGKPDAFNPLFVFNKSEREIAEGIFKGVQKAVSITRDRFGIEIRPELIGSVQADYRMIKRCYQQKHLPVSELYPNSAMGREYRKLAQYFLNQEAKKQNPQRVSPLHRILNYFNNEKASA